jgi:hypothetical protein
MPIDNPLRRARGVGEYALRPLRGRGESEDDSPETPGCFAPGANFCQPVGLETRQWAEATTQARGVEAVRVLVGLKHLAGKHPSDDLEEACRVALTHGAYLPMAHQQVVPTIPKSCHYVAHYVREPESGGCAALHARLFT